MDYIRSGVSHSYYSGVVASLLQAIVGGESMCGLVIRISVSCTIWCRTYYDVGQSDLLSFVTGGWIFVKDVIVIV
jgi:hypothetical protein